MKVRGLEPGIAFLEALRGFQVDSPVWRDQHHLTGTWSCPCEGWKCLWVP